MSKDVPVLSHIRRFDEIDTDSDFDVLPQRKPLDDSGSYSGTDLTESSTTKTKPLQGASSAAAHLGTQSSSVTHSNAQLPLKKVAVGNPERSHPKSSINSSSISLNSSVEGPPALHYSLSQKNEAKDLPVEKKKLSSASVAPSTSNVERKGASSSWMAGKPSESDEKLLIHKRKNADGIQKAEKLESASNRATVGSQSTVIASRDIPSLSNPSLTEEKLDMRRTTDTAIPEVDSETTSKPFFAHTPRDASSGVALSNGTTVPVMHSRFSPRVNAAALHTHDLQKEVTNRREDANDGTSVWEPMPTSSSTPVPVLEGRQMELWKEENQLPDRKKKMMDSRDSVAQNTNGRRPAAFTAEAVALSSSSSPEEVMRHSTSSEVHPVSGIFPRNAAETNVSHASSHPTFPHQHLPTVNSSFSAEGNANGLSASGARSHVGVGESRGYGRTSSIPTPSESALASAVRRLTAENKRLMEEVVYLTKENKRYRAATTTSPSSFSTSIVSPTSSQALATAPSECSISDQMKLQMTAQMLRKELLEREEQFFICTQNLVAERDGLLQQLQECVEQSEGQAASAVQYEKLYNEKVNELQALTCRYQVLHREVDEFDKKQVLLEKNHNDRLLVEKSRADKFHQLLEDAKGQRTHLQQRVLELQQQVEISARHCLEFEDAKHVMEEDIRKVRSEMEDKLESSKREVELLKDVQVQRQISHAAELGEERQMYDRLQKTMHRLTQDSTSKTESLRHDMENQRQECSKLLREERQRRQEAESKVQRLELAARRGPTSLNGVIASAPLIQELEQQLQKYREDFEECRRHRDSAIKKWKSCAEEVTELQDTLQYSAEETKALHAQFAEAENERREAECQNRLLHATIQELTSKDEQLLARNKELEDAMKTVLPAMEKSEEAKGNGASPFLSSRGVDVPALVGENERLTEECTRLSMERSHLQQENDSLAEEFLKWKAEVRRMMSASSGVRG